MSDLADIQKDIESLDNEQLVRLAYALYDPSAFDSESAQAFEANPPQLTEFIQEVARMVDVPSPLAPGSDDFQVARAVLRTYVTSEEGCTVLSRVLPAVRERTMATPIDVAVLSILAVMVLKSVVYIKAGKNKDGKSYYQWELGDRKQVRNSGLSSGGLESVATEFIRKWLSKLGADLGQKE